jgi:hypothetical protein
MNPDLGAVGAAATVSKRATSPRSPKVLKSFSVKAGDNGGVTVCENREAKNPGRNASYADSYDYKENPFGPHDQAEAIAHIRGLVAEMTGGARPDVESPAEDRGEAGEEPGERPRPARVAAVSGPGGTVGVARTPAAQPMRTPTGPYGAP